MMFADSDLNDRNCKNNFDNASDKRAEISSEQTAGRLFGIKFVSANSRYIVGLSPIERINPDHVD